MSSFRRTEISNDEFGALTASLAAKPEAQR
jgi:hypothetical protein